MDGGAGLAGSMTPDDAAHDPRGPEVVLVVDSGHVVRSASPSAATAFSVPADKLDDTPLFDLVYRGDRGRLNDALLRVQRDPSTPQTLAVRVLYDLPRAPWAELTVQPLHTGEAASHVKHEQLRVPIRHVAALGSRGQHVGRGPPHQLFPFDKETTAARLDNRLGDGQSETAAAG